MEFEWDEDKRRLNLEKHGIDFEDAITIWKARLFSPSPGKAITAKSDF